MNSSMVDALKSKMLATVDDSIAAAKIAVVDYAAQSLETWLNSGEFTQAVAEKLEPTFRTFEAEMTMIGDSSSPSGKGKKASAALPAFNSTIDV